MANKNVIWCDEKTLSKNLKGKTYIVTGSNSGVGFEYPQSFTRMFKKKTGVSPNEFRVLN